MKIILTLTFCLLAGLVSGQTLRQITINSTNTVPASATNTVNSAAIAVNQSTYLGVEVSGWLVGTNAYTNSSAAVVTLETSLSGTNWTANAARLAFTVNGTNWSSATSTTTMGGIPYVRIGKFENPADSPISNVFLFVYPKRDL